MYIENIAEPNKVVSARDVSKPDTQAHLSSPRRKKLADNARVGPWSSVLPISTLSPSSGRADPSSSSLVISSSGTLEDA